MTDLGHPFAQSFQALIEAMEAGVRAGVEQPAQTDLLFDSGQLSYLLPREIETVTRVSGLLNGRFTVFTRNIDYVQNGNRLVWQSSSDPEIPARTPRSGERFTVEYTFRDQPSGLNDFNAGSVVGTLVRAVARELTLMYDQIDEAYRRGFLDYASGAALDNVVALLGLKRNAPQYARGEVTFFAKREPRDTVAIPEGTRITDESGRGYVTTAPASIARVADDASAPVEPDALVGADGLVRLRERIARVVAVWDQADSAPTPANQYTRADVSPERPFGEDERTLKIVPRSGALPARVRVRYVPRSVRVPIVAQEAGARGDVGPRTIVVMPTPPSGVDGVVNEAATDGGKDAESDPQLRDRARFALERSGNATLNAIKYAVLEVDSITAVEVIDHSVDATIPLGEVHVRYVGEAVDKNDERTKVLDAVERTRAAGVIARLQTITTLVVSGTIVLLLEPGAAAAAAVLYRAEAVKALKALAPGQPLSLRRIGALGYSVPGIADIAEFQLAAQRNDPLAPAPAPPQPLLDDPFPVARGELVKVDEANLFVRALAALVVTGVEPASAGAFTLSAQLLDTAGAPVAFRAFALTVDVALSGRPLDRAEDVRESLGTVRKTLSFTDGSAGTLTLGPADWSRFDADVYAPEVDVVLTPSTYPGLRADAAKTTLRVGGA